MFSVNLSYYLFEFLSLHWCLEEWLIISQSKTGKTDYTYDYKVSIGDRGRVLNSMSTRTMICDIQNFKIQTSANYRVQINWTTC